MNEEKIFLATINIYVLAIDIKKYSKELILDIERTIKREISLYSLGNQCDVLLNVIPTLSSKSYLELSMNLVNINNDFINETNIVDKLHSTFLKILPSKISYFLFKQYKDENLIVVED